MSSVVEGAEPRPIGLREETPAERHDHRSRQEQEPRGGQPQALTGLTHSIAVLEASHQVETDLAETLRAMAARDHSEAAARRLRLAEDASRGARAAAETSERLQQHARRRAEYDDEAELRQKLDHVARVLAELARGENDIAAILTNLAAHNDPDLTAQRRQLASAASAAAKHARELARNLHRLAHPDAANGKSDRTPAADTTAGRELASRSAPRRLDGIDQRLTELRQTRLTTASGDGQDPRAGPDPVRRARLARQHWQESVANLLEARQLAVEALGRAASAHDRAAEANARSARAGIGDVAEHRRMAEFHSAAAMADRQQAEKFRDGAHDEAAGPAENPRKVADASS